MKAVVDFKNSWFYVLFAFIVVTTIVLGVFFSRNAFYPAYVDDSVLGSWSESLEKRESDSRFFGVEKWCSYTYENNENTRYPARLIVMTVRSLFMMDERDLRSKTLSFVKKVGRDEIDLNSESMKTGKRFLRNGHETYFFVFNGTNVSNGEKIKMIGEVWNCGVSHVSVICVGMAQVTDTSNGLMEYDYSNWEKIVADKKGTFGGEGYMSKNGLIYNVICH